MTCQIQISPIRLPGDRSQCLLHLGASIAKEAAKSDIHLQMVRGAANAASARDRLSFQDSRLDEAACPDPPPNIPKASQVKFCGWVGVGGWRGAVIRGAGVANGFGHSPSRISMAYASPLGSVVGQGRPEMFSTRVLVDDPGPWPPGG